MKAMKEALGQVDIITHIVFQIQSRHTLASLARVSRLLSEVALNQLWRTPPNLVVLARCMPQQYWNEVETYIAPYPGARHRTYKSQITLSSHERIGNWLGDRFRSYAARITFVSNEGHRSNRDKWPIRTPFIHTSSDENSASNERDESSLQESHARWENIVTSTVHDEVIYAWNSYSQDVQLLFSNLGYIHWSGKDGNDSHLINAFLTPSIIHLRISATPIANIRRVEGDPPPFDGTTLANIVRATTSSCPQFRSLSLSVSEDVMKTFSDIVKSLQLSGLSHFQTAFRPIGLKLLDNAAAWPHLQTFCATLSPSITSLSQSVLPNFPELRRLRLYGPSVDHLLSIWSATTSRQVDTLEISPWQELLPSQIMNILRSIVSHPSANSLRTLLLNRSLSPIHIRSVNQGASQREADLTMDMIKPTILELTHLTCFTLAQYTRYPYVFPSPAIRCMIQSWPDVTTIQITNDSPERISLEDFIHLIHDRPLLRRGTGLEVDCSIDSALPIHDGWQHRSLESIVFTARGSSSSSTSRIALVHYLLNTFPHISARCIQGDGTMRHFAFRAIRARRSRTPWSIDDYQKVFSGVRPATADLPVFTGHFTEDGSPILCYARAREDLPGTDSNGNYRKRSLHLSEGDIVAVTGKHEDGMWIGMLLDEDLYIAGKDLFWGESDRIEMI